MQASEIRALARMLDRLDYYRLLRVEAGAPLPHIRSAYQEARRQFHPDAYLAQAEDLRIAVERIARRITEAYLVLRDPGRRTAYDRGLEKGEQRFTPDAAEAVKQEADQRAGATANGRRFFAMAHAAEHSGDPARALSYLKMALTFEPKNPAFLDKLKSLQASAKP